MMTEPVPQVIDLEAHPLSSWLQRMSYRHLFVVPPRARPRSAYSSYVTDDNETDTGNLPGDRSTRRGGSSRAS
jgi:hypothetical protein